MLRRGLERARAEWEGRGCAVVLLVGRKNVNSEVRGVGILE